MSWLLRLHCKPPPKRPDQLIALSSMRLLNKAACVTGAGSGIGRETAVLFAKEGARVVCTDVNQSGVEETVRLIAAATGRAGDAVAMVVDVTKEAEVAAMVETCVTKFGGLDIMFANVRA